LARLPPQFCQLLAVSLLLVLFVSGRTTAAPLDLLYCLTSRETTPMKLSELIWELEACGWSVRRAGTRYGAADISGLCRSTCGLTDPETFRAWALAALA
jgi:hypothetical protein